MGILIGLGFWMDKGDVLVVYVRWRLLVVGDGWLAM
jgi:hypothetical protein